MDGRSAVQCARGDAMSESRVGSHPRQERSRPRASAGRVILPAWTALAARGAREGGRLSVDRPSHAFIGRLMPARSAVVQTQGSERSYARHGGNWHNAVSGRQRNVPEEQASSLGDRSHRCRYRATQSKSCDPVSLAPSGRPQYRSQATRDAIPLIPEVSADRASYPQLVHDTSHILAPGRLTDA